MGITNPRETAWRETSRNGLASSVPRSNSVRIVAKLTIRKSETTRLEIVSRVRLLFRSTFLKISFAYFIGASPFFRHKKAQKAQNDFSKFALFRHYALPATRVSGNPHL